MIHVYYKTNKNAWLKQTMHKHYICMYVNTYIASYLPFVQLCINVVLQACCNYLSKVIITIIITSLKQFNN